MVPLILVLFLMVMLVVNEDLQDEHESKANHDGGELEHTVDLLLPLSVEDLEHDDVKKRSGGHTLQSGHHNLGNRLGPGLADSDPNPYTEAADEAEYGEVGVEDGRPGA